MHRSVLNDLSNIIPLVWHNDLSRIVFSSNLTSPPIHYEMILSDKPEHLCVHPFIIFQHQMYIQLTETIYYFP